MLCTVKAVVLPSARRADGTWNVKIRITYNRRSRWLPTGIYVTQAQLTRSHSIKDATALMNAELQVGQVRAALAKMPPFWLEGRTVDDAVAWVRQELSRPGFRLDFLAFGRQVAEGKQGSTRKAYEVAVTSFAKYLGREECDISEVTTARLREYVSQLPPGAAHGYLGKLRYIYAQARARYNDEDAGVVRIPRDPFSGVKAPRVVPEGARWLTVEEMQRVILAETGDPEERRALDWFVISFGLMGMNYIDLLEAAPPKGGALVYERRKTRRRRTDRAEMRLEVPACLEPYVARQRERGGAHWLRAPRDSFEQKLARSLNAGLRRWAEREGVDTYRLKFYSARKTWGTVARSSACRIDGALIDDCLNHKTHALLDIYAARDWRVINDANATVLGVFTWPEG